MFKPGDKVRCIDNFSMEKHLKLGNLYTVFIYNEKDRHIYLNEVIGGAYAYRFVKVSDDTEDDLYV